MMLILFVILLLYVAYLILYPFKWVKTHKVKPTYWLPDFYIYSYQFHIHTQFSYDSLGKPEDVIRSMRLEDIDYAIVTDHDTDAIKQICHDPKVIVGIEKKITDEKGNILGDIISVENLRVVAHPFKEKYRWKLAKDEDLLVEIINLKDALLENKFRFFLFLLPTIFSYPILKEKSVTLLRKVIDVDSYAKAYLKDGWKNPVMGGLDHHVKIYIREVGMRFLFPSYRFSFLLMRNFLLSDREIDHGKDLVNAIKRNLSLISFYPKPSFIWVEDKKVYIQTPYENSLIIVEGNRKTSFEGSYAHVELDDDTYVLYAYKYLFRIGKLYLGLSPLFITALEVRKYGKAFTGGHKGEDPQKS